MNKTQELALSGLLHLTDKEADEVIADYRRLRELPAERERTKEALERVIKVYTGPTALSGCPCCGRQ